MKRILVILALFLVTTAQAHEGMWIPSLLNSLNAGHLEASGLRLSPDDIYSINEGSLKDAIVHFGGGCTAEVISDQGLILTNYHCGYGQVQSHSSVESDYLQEGFWAKNRSEELKNPGLTATFIVRIEDVTARISKGLTEGMSESERNKVIYENSALVETEYSVGGLEASVRGFFYGNEFYMIVTKTYTDVRLVGAPPSSIGKFGGDTDNWVWPRHTGDFSLFRIYADKSNSPADYSADNVPFSPSRHLQISLDGADDNDFVMVYGFPGSTEQYLPSQSVDYVMNTSNPMRIEMREKSLNIIDRAMASDDKVRIQYAAKQASISNAYKKWIGQNFGLKKFKALDKKKEFEAEFKDWLRTDKEAKAKYGSLLENLDQAQGELERYQLARELLIEYVYYGPEIIRFANRFDNLVENFAVLDSTGELDATVESLKNVVHSHFKNYNANIDHEVFKSLTPFYIEKVDAALLPAYFKNEFRTKHNESIENMSNHLYGKSMFVHEEELLELLDKVNAKSIKAISKDLAYRISGDVFKAYSREVRPNLITRRDRMSALMRDYVTAQQEMNPEEMFWPDANSTLRLTYGRVEGSRPRDGVEYLSHTTLKGVVDKYVPGHADFDLPPKIIELYESKDYGQYADKDGKLYVCFTGSNHTSGGNSGSPALDADGHLIGLNFDRSWESTMSDIAFSPDLCRNIMVDIRYVLFIIDKYADADHIIDELDLISGDE